MCKFAIRYGSGIIRLWRFPTGRRGDPLPRQKIDNRSRRQRKLGRIQSLTVKRALLIDIDRSALTEELEELAGEWVEQDEYLPDPYDNAGLLRQPLLFTLALLPHLTSLRIYDPSTCLKVDDFVDCIGAWMPCLTIFHLYQDALETRLLEEVIKVCQELVEVEVSGLMLAEEPYGRHLVDRYNQVIHAEQDGIERQRKIREWEDTTFWEFSELAFYMSLHPKLRHFASDRRNMKALPCSPHGVFLRKHYTSKCPDPPKTLQLHSLDLRDKDLQVELLIEYLTHFLSAEIQRLVVIVGRDEEKEREAEAKMGDKSIKKRKKKDINKSIRPDTLDLCTRQYDSPCFLQATTDLELACNKDFFPLAFFRRIGHRVTSLRMYRKTRRHSEDTILAALHSGYLSRLDKVLVMGSSQDQKERYVEELRAANAAEHPLQYGQQGHRGQ